MKRLGCGGMAITILVLLVFIGSPLRAQPDKMILDDSKVAGRKTRPEVTFPHSRHMESDLSCKDCHHVYKDGKNVLEESDLNEGNQGIHCSACHGAKVRPNLQEAFHHQCIGCHTKKSKGPRLCGECHVRK